jgi:hypothetical protein
MVQKAQFNGKFKVNDHRFIQSSDVDKKSQPPAPESTQPYSSSSPFINSAGTAPTAQENVSDRNSFTEGGLDLAMFLRHHSLFSQASTEFIDTLVKKMHLRPSQPGDYIIREGELGRAMFLVVKGFVTVSSKDGESIFADLGPGSFFGGKILWFETILII